MDFDVYNLSERSRKIIDKMKLEGYQPIMEFKPREEWPKEGHTTPLDDRYLFSCNINGEWVTEISDCPDTVVRNLEERLIRIVNNL